MTENENYYYNDGYQNALNYLSEIISIHKNNEVYKPLVNELLATIITAKHSRHALDKISNEILEQMGKKQ